MVVAMADAGIGDYERVLNAALHAVETQVSAMVERALAGLPDDPDAPLPWIGVWRDERAKQKQVVIAALICRQWCKYELPRWAPELPLRMEDIYKLTDLGTQGSSVMQRRSGLVGNYAQTLRGMAWDRRYVPRFERYIESRVCGDQPEEIIKQARRSARLYGRSSI